MVQKSPSRKTRIPKIKILFVASEVVPYAKTGGLADVAGALPKALAELECEVAIVMPKYQSISDSKYRLSPLISQMWVPMGMGDVDASVFQSFIGNDQVPVYFIQNNHYFDRDQLYGTSDGDYQDNAERFAFFSRSIFSLMKELNWYPDILHLNDWQTGLVAAYQKNFYRQDAHFSKMKTLFTIHNLAYQGLYPKYFLPMTGLGWEEFTADRIEYYDQISYLKAGLVYSDCLTTVSPTYADEIQTDEMGSGLQGVLRSRTKNLFGILNGIDQDEWDPAIDSSFPYTVKNLKNKQEAKRKLLAEQGLRYDPQTPIFGLISRLTNQKGLDLIFDILEPFLSMDIQLIILGTGDVRYHQMLEDFKNRFPEKIGLNLKFDNRLAQLIYAGSDIFLMPSRFEPCGLGQMIAMRYGTIPLVRKTGGLADTVKNFSPNAKESNGFVFENYSGPDLLSCTKKAVEAFHQPKLWKFLIQNAMKCDFSWKNSAKEYLKLYLNLQKS
jgi:starch synthase